MFLRYSNQFPSVLGNKYETSFRDLCTDQALNFYTNTFLVHNHLNETIDCKYQRNNTFWHVFHIHMSLNRFVSQFAMLTIFMTL